MGRIVAFVTAAAIAALAFAGPAGAAQGMLVGAAEDAGKEPNLAMAKTKMDLAKLAGLDAIRLTAQWKPGETAPLPADLASLQNAVDAADLDGITVFLSVYPTGSSVTPLTPAARAQFVSFAGSLAQSLPTVHRFIVGNEPNLNRFWMPQYTASGADAAAPAYEAMLAQTYDALKAVSPSVIVIGGALSPRGDDSVVSKKHSPTTFLTDLGKAYRSSGRTRPIMDAFALHPYEDNSSLPPTFAHPKSTTISLADYPKLVALLGDAFDGTAQPGSTLPIYYDEFGVQTTIPAAEAVEYVGAEPPSTKSVTEATQARYYDEALALAACQPTVAGLLLFHVSDESNLARWQSGLFYANDAPKASEPIVARGIQSLRATGVHPCTASGVLAFAARQSSG
ncbi:MAG TPA: hypothetical protein VHS03_06785 [Gaiellaceae bacterium]|nr:hypothetical protein [Gaiellaceae bacterium]